MIGLLLNNLLAYFDIQTQILFTIDFFTGNSLLITLLLYLISYRFNYCKWHRILITTNFINLIIAYLDCLEVTDLTCTQLILFYYTIAAIGVAIATYTHVKDIQNESKVKIN